MGINLNVNAADENEFNQQLQLYLAQGYSMQSNYNGTAILKKKSYSTGVLIVLVILFFPAAILYYLLASEDIVTITMGDGNASNVSSTGSSVSFDSYCEDCGHGLYADSKFCPGCGKHLADDTEEKNVFKCNTCGAELTEENKFCPNCGGNVVKE